MVLKHVTPAPFPVFSLYNYIQQHSTLERLFYSGRVQICRVPPGGAGLPEHRAQVPAVRQERRSQGCQRVLIAAAPPRPGSTLPGSLSQFPLKPPSPARGLRRTTGIGRSRAGPWPSPLSVHLTLRWGTLAPKRGDLRHITNYVRAVTVAAVGHGEPPDAGHGRPGPPATPASTRSDRRGRRP
jgi:hypothetical protein